MRRWLGRIEDEKIGAALEATTGWRFLVEELETVGRLELLDAAQS